MIINSRSFLKICLLYAEIHLYKHIQWQITVERLKYCDWFLDKFIEGRFSKLTDSNHIFRMTLFSFIMTSKILPQIIECKIFGSIWTLYNYLFYGCTDTTAKTKGNNLQNFGNFAFLKLTFITVMVLETLPKTLGLYNENFTRGTHLKFAYHQHVDDSALS